MRMGGRKACDTWFRGANRFAHNQEVSDELSIMVTAPASRASHVSHSQRFLSFSLFAAEPRTKQVFGFDEHEDIEHSGLKQMGVLIHAKRLVGMLETTIGLLGPDVETLTEILSQLGRRHINYGVKLEFSPVMDKAIRDALAETLKEEWTKDVDDAWCTVYNELSAEIVKSMLNVA
jgi:hemoglobin-like flavoprotein